MLCHCKGTWPRSLLRNKQPLLLPAGPWLLVNGAIRCKPSKDNAPFNWPIPSNVGRQCGAGCAREGAAPPAVLVRCSPQAAGAERCHDDQFHHIHVSSRWGSVCGDGPSVLQQKPHRPALCVRRPELCFAEWRLPTCHPPAGSPRRLPLVPMCIKTHPMGSV